MDAGDVLGAAEALTTVPMLANAITATTTPVRELASALAAAESGITSPTPCAPSERPDDECPEAGSYQYERQYCETDDTPWNDPEIQLRLVGHIAFAVVVDHDQLGVVFAEAQLAGAEIAPIEI